MANGQPIFHHYSGLPATCVDGCSHVKNSGKLSLFLTKLLTPLSWKYCTFRSAQFSSTDGNDVISMEKPNAVMLSLGE